MTTTTRDIDLTPRSRDAFSNLRRGIRVWRSGGSKGLAQRAARVMYRRLDAGSLDFPLLFGDVADSRQLNLPVPARTVDRDRPLRVGWISTPPGIGSGGHTTMFRMVAALESAGHDCTMFLYDRYGGDAREHEATIRQGWPSVRARVVDVADGIVDVDACIASSWSTAHVLASRGSAPMRRFYFVQDFEPFFYPLGAEYALAEDSYRFGFRCITIGHMLAGLLRERIGIDADIVDFGCDDDVYRLTSQGPREGVVFYARRHNARRGLRLGLLALQALHERRPDVPIHAVGDPGVRMPFPAINHGVCSPPDLAALYNQTIAGLALSFTNLTLLAEEFLACGTVPVMNETFDFRADVANEYVRWTSATPSGIADALIDLVDAPPNPGRVAATARSQAWRPAQSAFVQAVEEGTYAPDCVALGGRVRESGTLYG